MSKAKKVLYRIIFGITLVLAAIFSFTAILAIRFRIIYSTNIVQQYSMVPVFNLSLYLKDPYLTFEDNDTGDWAYARKHSNFGINDIVIADVPYQAETIIKRVVGMPGDKIRITVERDDDDNIIAYNLLVNEKILYTKPYKQYLGKNPSGEDVYTINSNTYRHYLDFLKSDEFKANTHLPENVKDLENNPDCYIVVNENECILLGDNWSNSKDSFMVGPIKLNQIKGKVVYIIDSTKNKIWESIKLMYKDAF